MRRLQPQTVDELDRLCGTLLEFRANDGRRFPVYAEPMVFFLGKQPDGVAPMAELRAWLGLPQPRTSRLCAALAREGLVQVYPSLEHGRASSVKLTAKGLRLIDKTLSAYRSYARPRL